MVYGWYTVVYKVYGWYTKVYRVYGWYTEVYKVYGGYTKVYYGIRLVYWSIHTVFDPPPCIEHDSMEIEILHREGYWHL